MGVFYRRLPKFEYLRPRSPEEALEFLSGNQGKTRVMAGGTDLIVQLRRREIPTPQYVLDIKDLSDLAMMNSGEAEGLRIGALTPISAVAGSAEIRKNYPVITQAALSIASPQIRNRATFAGNICNAVPSADSAPALLVMNASVNIRSSRGERKVPIDEFFTGPRKTVLAPDEIVTSVEMPKTPAGGRGIYLKHSQRHSMDLALVGVAVYAVMEGDTCRDIRIALGAVAPTPYRSKGCEDFLRGRRITGELINEAAGMASTQCSPINDHRSSAEYRCDMVSVLVKRALSAILL
jgi:carbon-monoxide dehydrogenase medium subunit